MRPRPAPADHGDHPAVVLAALGRLRQRGDQPGLGLRQRDDVLGADGDGLLPDRRPEGHPG